MVICEMEMIRMRTYHGGRRFVVTPVWVDEQKRRSEDTDHDALSGTDERKKKRKKNVPLSPSFWLVAQRGWISLGSVPIDTKMYRCLMEFGHAIRVLGNWVANRCREGLNRKILSWNIHSWYIYCINGKTHSRHSTRLLWYLTPLIMIHRSILHKIYLYFNCEFDGMPQP